VDQNLRIKNIQAKSILRLNTRKFSPSDNLIPMILSALNKVGGKLHPILVELTLNGLKTTMELDMGVAVSVMSNETKVKLFPKLKPETTLIILTT